MEYCGFQSFPAQFFTQYHYLVTVFTFWSPCRPYSWMLSVKDMTRKVWKSFWAMDERFSSGSRDDADKET